MRGSYATLAVHLTGATLGLVVQVAITWLLGSETEYGIYLVALSTVTIAAVPVVAGWDTVLTRYLSEYDERREGSGAAGSATELDASERAARLQRAEAVTRHAAARLTRWSLLSIGIGLAIAVAIAAAPETFRPWTPVTAIGVAISIPIVGWTLLRQGALRGRHRGALSIVPEAIVRPTMTVAVSALAIGLGAAATGNLVLLAQIAAGSAALICGSRLLPRGLRHAMRPTWTGRRHGLDPTDLCGAEAVEGWRRMAGASLLTGVAVAVTMRVDEWLLGLMVGPDAAGVYGPASRFAAFVAFGLNAVNPVLGPLVAAHRADIARCRKLAKRAARFALIIALPMTILLLLRPDWALGVLPEAYGESAGVLRLLAVVQFVNVSFGSVGTLLAMTGHHREQAKILVVAAIADIVLCLILIPIFGPFGAAIATGITIVGWNVACWWAVRRLLGFDPTAF